MYVPFSFLVLLFAITVWTSVETAQEVERAILSPRLVKAVLRGEKVAIELFESTSRRNALIDIDMSKYKKIDLGKGMQR